MFIILSLQVSRRAFRLTAVACWGGIQPLSSNKYFKIESKKQSFCLSSLSSLIQAFSSIKKRFLHFNSECINSWFLAWANNKFVFSETILFLLIHLLKWLLCSFYNNSRGFDDIFSGQISPLHLNNSLPVLFFNPLLHSIF